MLVREEGRVAVVTGANRGLGFETCRQLAADGYRVVLTSRGSDAARNAAGTLGVDHAQLDVSDSASISRVVAELREKYGHIDVLVNNAGVSIEGFDESVARRTMAVNLLGSMAVTDAVRPLLSPNASVVMVSSGMGELSCLSVSLRAQFIEPDPSRDRLLELIDEFIRDVGHGTWESKGWPTSAYRVSKVGLNTFTRIVARELADTGTLVNAVCPGWARTDMGGPDASRSVEMGAESIVWAATLSHDGPTGGFFRDGKRIQW